VTEQVPTYNAETIAEKLTALPGWSFGDGLIYQEYHTDGWPTTLMLQPQHSQRGRSYRF